LVTRALFFFAICFFLTDYQISAPFGDERESGAARKERGHRHVVPSLRVHGQELGDSAPGAPQQNVDQARSVRTAQIVGGLDSCILKKRRSLNYDSMIKIKKYLREDM